MEDKHAVEVGSVPGERLQQQEGLQSLQSHLTDKHVSWRDGFDPQDGVGISSDDVIALDVMTLVVETSSLLAVSSVPAINEMGWKWTRRVSRRGGQQVF